MTKDLAIRIVKRNNLTKTRKAIIISSLTVICFIISLLFLLIISGRNPFISLKLIFQGTFYKGKIKESTIQEIFLLFGVTLALIPAYKMKYWNVGAQGQILMGGLLTAVFMIAGEKAQMPTAVVILLSLLGALIGGGIWAMIPAIFKAKWNTNETLFTLMMNYIAIQIVKFATDNWRGDKASLGIINFVSKRGWLPEWGNAIVLPMIIIIIIAIYLFVYINKTKHGYELKVVGESPNTARYAGINVKMTIIRTVTISGIICGLIGFFYVAGFDHTIDASSTGGQYGFTAIIACWLGNFNPFICFLYAFLIVFLNKGAKNLANKNWTNLNEYSCEFIFLIVILTIMIIKFFMEYKLTGKFIDKINAKIEAWYSKVSNKIKEKIANIKTKKNKEDKKEEA